ncbi:MAG: HAMP domain-containing histidine kinase [Deltaproteobacteria bacterium]|nr:HAMP domain-containing histidine kinase [Deltaproteobacteria bacterium]
MSGSEFFSSRPSSGSDFDQPSGVIDRSRVLVRWTLREGKDPAPVTEAIRQAGLVPVRSDEPRTLAEGARTRIAIVDMDVPEATGMLMVLSNSVRAIIALASDDQQDQSAMRCGADQTVRWPVSVETLALHIKRAVKWLDSFEQERERAEKQAVLARADSVQHVAGMMAQELYGPVSVASTNIKMLQQQMVEERAARQVRWDQLQELVDDVSSAVGSMNHIIAEMRTLARVGAQPAEPVCVADVVRDAIAAAPNPRRVPVELEVVTDQRAMANQELLERVLRGLLAHAFAWTSTTLTPRVKVRIYTDAGEVRVSVRDNGPGVTAQDRERIFEPSFAASISPGSISLAVCRELVARMGGVLTIASGGPGTCLRVRLVPG